MSKAKIQIVEDEAVIAMDVENQLHNLGYQVTSVVSSGNKAIEKAAIDKPDLILMDIRIQGELDGIETADLIRRNHSIPIVFSTAYLDKDRIERAKVSMPFGYVLKPIQERELKVTLEMALYISNAEKQRRQHEDWLESTLNSIGDAVIVTNSNSEITLINRVAEKLLGLDKKDALGKALETVFQIVNEHTRLPTENPVELVLKDKKAVSLPIDTILISKDGSETPIDDVAAPIIGKNGEMTGVVLVFRDVTERKKSEQLLKESEGRVKRKLQALLSPEGDIGELTLSDLIDVDEFQSMMDSFNRLSGLLVAILDHEGKILVSSGWQDICTKFHRVHPETSQFCLESDTELSKETNPGAYKQYKCKNNLWDISTPIFVAGKHLGNMYFGQFFYKDEEIDEDLFIAQAQKYGFNTKDYLDALYRVPRLDKKTVQDLMNFYTRFATNIANHAFSNLKLTRSIHQKPK